MTFRKRVYIQSVRKKSEQKFGKNSYSALKSNKSTNDILLNRPISDVVMHSNKITGP